ncbi:MAG: 5-formyltetrahydrofolate cyclo-ligase [Thermoleophilia bacterium]
MTENRIASAKSRVRREMLARRSTMSPAVRAAQSRLICQRAADLPEIAAAHTVMGFASFGSEIDTSTLLDSLLACGKQLCLPRVLGPRTMAAHVIVNPRADLKPGAWDIPEPTPDRPVVDPAAIDVMVVPGVAFDVQGHRYGYGGGFYDSFLPHTRAGVPRVALAFELQVVDHLDCEAHDLTVDIVVTEERVLRCTPA